MSRHVIIGGGPAGVTTAWRLAKNGESVLLIEAASGVGGISRTFKRDDYLLDYGPHAFHIKEEYITELVREICGDDFRIIPTKTHIMLKSKRFKYPLELYDVIFHLNPLLSLRMILDYAAAALKNRLAPKPDVSFETWGVTHFGRTLYELCFGRYTERVWGVPPSRLSNKLAQQKLHKLNLMDVIRKLLGGRGEEQKAYFKSYIYPKYGMGEVFERMVGDIERAGGIVALGSAVTEITVKEGRAAEVSYVNGAAGRVEKAACDMVVSTVSLAALTRMIRPGLEDETLGLAGRLKFRDLVLVYFTVNRDYVTDSQWTYLVEQKFIFNRFAEQKNLSPDMMPPDKTVISFEICCNRGDDLWTATDEALFELAAKDIDALGLFKPEEILDRFTARVENAYPVYDLGFDERTRTALASLARFPNLYSAGRNGLFLNTDMHDSIEMGLLAAEAARERTTSGDWYRQMERYVAEKLEGTK